MGPGHHAQGSHMAPSACIVPRTVPASVRIPWEPMSWPWGSEVRSCTLEAAASDTCPRSQDSRLMQALELVPRGVNSLPVTIEG